jgi:hypothetical protein
MKEKKR